jgi:hypothetical protein
MPEPAQPVTNGRPVVAYALIFMGVNLFVILTRLDDFGKNRAYPFSAMTFYSNVAASKPYSDNLHYPFPYGELELEYTESRHQKWSCFPNINSLYVMVYLDETPASKLSQQIGAIQGVMQRIKSGGLKEVDDCVGVVNLTDYTAIDLYASILDIPPYPEKVRFDIGFRALVGRYEPDRNRLIAAAGHVRKSKDTVPIEVRSQGMDVARYDILLANDPWKHYKIGPLITPSGRWNGDTFEIAIDFYMQLPTGWYPIVVRVTEVSGRSYDFFGGILYR